jgi:hypothetical protein
MAPETKPCFGTSKKMTQNCSEDPQSTKNYRTYMSALRIQSLTEPCDIIKLRLIKQIAAQSAAG